MRPLNAAFGTRPAPRPALACAGPSSVPPRVLLRGARRWRLPLDRPAPRGLGLVLTIALLIGAAALGAARGGQYQEFVSREGSIGDFIARALGLGVDAVTISGEAQLAAPEILSVAGVGPVTVNIVWQPPWTPERMSDEARLVLNMW